MAKIIYKFKIDVSDVQEIEMPFGSEVLKIDTQLGIEGSHKYPKDRLQMWCMCPVDSTKIKRTFVVVATGSEFDDKGLRYIDSVIFKASNLVYHVFEKI